MELWPDIKLCWLVWTIRLSSRGVNELLAINYWFSSQLSCSLSNLHYRWEPKFQILMFLSSKKKKKKDEWCGLFFFSFSLRTAELFIVHCKTYTKLKSLLLKIKSFAHISLFHVRQINVKHILNSYFSGQVESRLFLYSPFPRYNKRTRWRSVFRFIPVSLTAIWKHIEVIL